MKQWLDETVEAMGLNEGFSLDDAAFALEMLLVIIVGWFLLVLTV